MLSKTLLLGLAFGKLVVSQSYEWPGRTVDQAESQAHAAAEALFRRDWPEAAASGVELAIVDVVMDDGRLLAVE